MAPLPRPVRTRPLLGKAGPLYLLACLFLHDSVWVTISSSSQGEQRRNRHQRRVIYWGRRRHGHRPVDACQANLRAECLLYYIIVRSNSLALIKMKSLLNLFTYFNCYHYFFFLSFLIFFCSVLSSVIIKIIIIVTFRLSCFLPPPHHDIKWILTDEQMAVQRGDTHDSR